MRVMWLLVGILACMYSVAAHAVYFDQTDILYPDAVDRLSTAGVLSGYDDGTFRPNNKVNRAEFVKILMGAYPHHVSKESCVSEGHARRMFHDVATNVWYWPFLCSAVDNRIEEQRIDGYPDGNFRPERPVTLVEAAKILAIADGYEYHRYDNFQSTWYEPYVRWLGDKGAIPLTVQGLDHELNRQEVAEMIWRVQGDLTFIPSWNYQQVAERLGEVYVRDPKGFAWPAIPEPSRVDTGQPMLYSHDEAVAINRIAPDSESCDQVAIGSRYYQGHYSLFFNGGSTSIGKRFFAQGIVDREVKMFTLTNNRGNSSRIFAIESYQSCQGNKVTFYEHEVRTYDNEDYDIIAEIWLILPDTWKVLETITGYYWNDTPIYSYGVENNRLYLTIRTEDNSIEYVTWWKLEDKTVNPAIVFDEIEERNIEKNVDLGQEETEINYYDTLRKKNPNTRKNWTLQPEGSKESKFQINGTEKIPVTEEEWSCSEEWGDKEVRNSLVKQGYTISIGDVTTEFDNDTLYHVSSIEDVVSWEHYVLQDSVGESIILGIMTYELGPVCGKRAGEFYAFVYEEATGRIIEARLDLSTKETNESIRLSEIWEEKHLYEEVEFGVDQGMFIFGFYDGGTRKRSVWGYQDVFFTLQEFWVYDPYREEWILEFARPE